MTENTENTEKKAGLFFLIPKTLKKKFRILCVENDTDMSTEIVKFIEIYVERED